MQLKISNVGKIEKATIDINGLTVIAGENNAGKSTIGKTLFSIFNSMNNMGEKIEQERENRVKSIVNRTLQGKISHDATYTTSRRRTIVSTTRLLSEMIMDYWNSESTQKLSDRIKEPISQSSLFESQQDENEFVSECEEKIEELFAISDKKVMMEVITRWFDRVFENQISPLREETAESKVELLIKEKKVLFTFRENICVDWNSDVNILHEAFYIDNPFVLDYLAGYDSSSRLVESHLIEYLEKEEKDIYNNLFDAVVAKDKLCEIDKILGEVVKGDIEENQNGEYYFKSDKDIKPLNIVNLSTGLKSFALIKHLLKSGCIKEKDVLILDEPEVHLHPEWQLLYAKLIVLLQKEFDLSMIITTHSPYFLDAIDVFSKKYDVFPRPCYYLAENVGETSTLHDVSDNIDAIYKKLSEPMQLLENLRYNS